MCALVLQNGDKQVGVCLLYTVLKMDAGPIIAQEVVDIDEGIQAHELLHHLFSIGTRSVVYVPHIGGHHNLDLHGLYSRVGHRTSICTEPKCACMYFL